MTFEHADDEPRSFIIARLAWAYLTISNRSSELLEAHADLTNRQFNILAELVASEPRTAADLARRTDVDKALVSRNLKVLREMGLIQWRQDPEDGRAKILSLTESGVLRHAKAMQLMRAWNDHLLEGFGLAELDAFFDALRRFEERAGAHDPTLLPEGDALVGGAPQRGA